MIDVDEWDRDWNAELNSLVEDVYFRFEQGEIISLHDLSPDLKNLLKDKTYGVWRYPKNIDILSNHPVTNLATILTTEPSPEVILAYLSPIESLSKFKETYGLGGNLSYNHFLDLIRSGRICLILNTWPKNYRQDFFQDIFKACLKCDQGSYLPQHLEIVYGSLTGTISSNILGYRVEYFDEIHEKIKRTLNPETPKDLMDAYPNITPNRFERIAATRAHLLSTSGFDKQIKKSISLFQENPLVGFEVLESYHRYLLSGYPSMGGFHFYDKVDAENMQFLRLIEDKNISSLKELTGISPADFVMVADPFNNLFMINHDTDDLNKALKSGPDVELSQVNNEVQKSINSYDFNNFFAKSQELSEIIEERIVKETETNYKHSNLIQKSVRLCGALAIDLGLASLQVPYPISTIAGFALQEPPINLKNYFDTVSQYLSKRWIFREKGVPSYLWYYNIKSYN